MKIVSIRVTSAHCLAGCLQCSWTAGIFTDETPTSRDVRYEARKHVRESGHTTWVETAATTHYEPEEAAEHSVEQMGESLV